MSAAFIQRRFRIQARELVFSVWGPLFVRSDNKATRQKQDKPIPYSGTVIIPSQSRWYFLSRTNFFGRIYFRPKICSRKSNQGRHPLQAFGAVGGLQESTGFQEENKSRRHALDFLSCTKIVDETFRRSVSVKVWLCPQPFPLGFP